MKNKILAVGFFLASCLLLPAPSYAQFTTVTATVQDPNGIPYAGAVLNAVLVPSTGGGYTLSGQPYSGRIGPVTLDSAGKFTVNFGDVTLITPGSPQWQITIDSAAATIAGPLGTGPQSFTYTSTGTTISGSSPVSLTTALNALAPKLTNFASGGSGTVTSIAATSPVVVTPNPITATGTISCPTCSTSSSTVPINQVVSATGAITPIALGSNTLEFDCATPSPTYCEIFGETSASTSGRIVEITTLTGSAAQPLSITPGAAGPAGANAPNSIGITGQAGGAAGTSQNGFSGSGIFIQAGAGSAGGATSGNGGTGGTWTLGGGNGGAAGGSSGNNGGNGGVVNWGIGAGANGAATGNGGNAGSFNVLAGNGGTGGATSGTGGAGSDFIVNTGVGGGATAGSTSGRGGTVTFNISGAGVTGTAGVPGKFLISRSGPTGSTTTPLLDVVDTWNTSGVVDALIRANVTTDTASGAGSLLLDLQDVGSTKFSVDKAGNIVGNALNTIPVSTGQRSVASSVAVGPSALAANGSGTDTQETAVGVGALGAETGSAGGGNSAAFGWHALILQNGSNGNNAAFGELALGSLTTGNNDTGFGRGACFNLTTTNNNTCVGSTNNLGAATDSNETVIGATATGAGSNTATIGNASVTDAYFGSSTPTAVVHAKGFNTATNCSSSASPAVCGSAAAGSVVIAAAGTTVTVNTTAVTANSQIFLLADDTLGTKLSVTCNSTLATLIGGLAVTARTGGTSFQITSGATPAVNPLCLSYFIVN
jgi:hypothetical protein